MSALRRAVTTLVLRPIYTEGAIERLGRRIVAGEHGPALRMEVRLAAETLQARGVRENSADYWSAMGVFWEFWKTYAPGPDDLARDDLVLSILRERGPASLLEVGCGNGRMIAKVREVLPDSRVVGLDLSRPLCEWARRLTGAEIIHDSILADTRLPDVEAVYFPGTLEYMPFDEAYRAFNRVARASKWQVGLWSPAGLPILELPESVLRSRGKFVHNPLTVIGGAAVIEDQRMYAGGKGLLTVTRSQPAPAS